MSIFESQFKMRLGFNESVAFLVKDQNGLRGYIETEDKYIIRPK